MKMTGLKELYKNMKAQKLPYHIFKYNHNTIELEILFDINRNPFGLLIIKQYSNLTLLLDIKTGFELDVFLTREKYQVLREILEIKSGKTNSFSTKKFFEELNNAIPSCVKEYKIDNNLRYIISQVKNLDKAHLIYVKCLIDWSKTESGKHVSDENREKTKYLYPDIFELIKDKNISVVYTNNEKYSHHTNIKDIGVIYR
ncbi:MAG: hypothetical protein IJ950_08190 [Helicobacter sp.]|nr:hypothetical protein [Helicobacter sp.]